VREAGIPPAVRVRFLAETSSGLKRQQGTLRRLRLRIGSGDPSIQRKQHLLMLFSSTIIHFSFFSFKF